MGETIRTSSEASAGSHASVPSANWHAILENAYGLTSMAKHEHSESVINILDTGELTVASVHMSGQQLSSLRRSSHDATGQIFIKHIVRGTALFEQNGKYGHVGAGSLVAVDPAWPFTEQVDDQVQMVVLGCSKAALQRRGYPSSLKQWVEADPCSPDVQLFQEMSSLLTRYQGAASHGTIARLASQLLDMADSTILGGDGQHGGRVREAAFFRTERYINENLEDNKLDAAKIANGIGLSVGYLNHLFREYGTSLMRYVWERRIERAHDMLKNPACRRLLIDEIAWECGFSSPAHFSRMFKRTYGRSPREMRSADLNGQHSGIAQAGRHS